MDEGIADFTVNSDIRIRGRDPGEKRLDLGVLRNRDRVLRPVECRRVVVDVRDRDHHVRLAIATAAVFRFGD